MMWTEPETFSRDYVEGLRKESAAHRLKAKTVDAANARLVASYAAQDGRLVNGEALAYDDALLDADGLVDREKVAAAITATLGAKPYLASRRPTASLPQGVLPDGPEPVSLSA